MKILIVAEKIPPDYSGAGVRIVRHAAFLNNIGMLSYLITATNCDRYYQNPNLNLIRNKIISLSLLKNCNNVYIDKLIFIINAIISFIATGIVLFTKRNDYEIVHSFSNAITPLSGAFFGIILKKKIIFESTLLGNDTKLSGKFKHINKYVLKHSAFIVCISEALKLDFAKLGINMYKLKVIHNDVNLDEFKYVNKSDKYDIRVKLGFENSDKLILFVGSLSYRKGIDIFTKIIAKLATVKPNLHYLLIGHTDSKENIEAINHLKYIANLNNIINNVHIVGPSNDVPSFMMASDVFVFTSRREGFGTVQIEAMAVGCPVVASYLPGISEEIYIDGENGFLVYDQNDIDEYSRLIIKLSEDENLRNFICENAYLTVKQKFSAEIIMNKYISLYKSCM